MGIELFIEQIEDPEVRENFQRLVRFTDTQTFLQGEWRLYELQFEKAVSVHRVPHLLSFIPLDVLVLSKLGSGQVVFKYNKFDRTNMEMEVTGPCHIRFLAGRQSQRMVPLKESIATAEPTVPTTPTTPANGQDTVYVEGYGGTLVEPELEDRVLIGQSEFVDNPSGFVRDSDSDLRDQLFSATDFELFYAEVPPVGPHLGWNYGSTVGRSYNVNGAAFGNTLRDSSGSAYAWNPNQTATPIDHDIYFLWPGDQGRMYREKYNGASETRIDNTPTFVQDINPTRSIIRNGHWYFMGTETVGEETVPVIRVMRISDFTRGPDLEFDISSIPNPQGFTSTDTHFLFTSGDNNNLYSVHIANLSEPESGLTLERSYVDITTDHEGNLWGGFRSVGDNAFTLEKYVSASQVEQFQEGPTSIEKLKTLVGVRTRDLPRQWYRTWSDERPYSSAAYNGMKVYAEREIRLDRWGWSYQGWQTQEFVDVEFRVIEGAIIPDPDYVSTGRNDKWKGLSTLYTKVVTKADLINSTEAGDYNSNDTTNYFNFPVDVVLAPGVYGFFTTVRGTDGALVNHTIRGPVWGASLISHYPSFLWYLYRPWIQTDTLSKLTDGTEFDDFKIGQVFQRLPPAFSVHYTARDIRYF